MKPRTRSSLRSVETLEPRQLLAADLLAHWRASELDATLVDGQPVTAWNDLVGNRAVSVQGVPTFAKFAVEGKSAIRFQPADGADWFRLIGVNNPINGKTEFSIVVVLATEANSLRGTSSDPWFKATGIVDANTNGFSDDWGMAINASGQIGVGMGAGFGQPTTTLYSSQAGWNNGERHVVTMVRAGSELGIKIDDGPLESRFDATDKPRSLLQVAIGALSTNDGHFAGDIAEVRMYGGRLTNDELIATHSELASYYRDDNTPPVANADHYVVAEDSVLTRTALEGVLANDTDAEGNLLQATLIDAPAHGTLQFSADGSFVYTPSENYFGPDQFTYRVSDGRAQSQLGQVTLEVQSVNDRPIARRDLIVSVGSTPVVLPSERGILANDTDVDHPSLTVRLISPPRHGALTLNADGSLQYVPPEAFLGNDSFQYVASDGVDDSLPTTVYVEVVAPANQIVINEVHYDPPDNTVREEFIELVNVGAEPVDLANWYFSNGVSFVFPAGVVLAPGGYLVVAQDPATLRAGLGAGLEPLGPWDGRLSSEGETIILHRANGSVADFVDYRQGFPWPVAAGGEGPSMELIHPFLDNDLGGSWRAGTQPTPGRENSIFSPNAPPQTRQVNHSPMQPRANESTTVTVKVTDPHGIQGVSLQYQVVLAGAYIPAVLPLPLAELRRRPTAPRQPNPVYHDPANWVTLAMFDDGTHGDLEPGDAIYTTVIPGQPNRTLMRYRIDVTDVFGDSVRVPYTDDESRNFAYFVYDGVPDYNGHSSTTLQRLPVYHLIARNEDVKEVMAYETSQEISQGSLARFSYNWPATFVYEGVVYDNISFRLRGANGRYQLDGKRSMRFRFNDGHYFQAKDQRGKPYPEKWRTLTTGKMFDNRLTLTYSLNEAVSYRLFDTLGVPAADTHYAHFRVIDSADENGRYSGDFWGLTFIIETYDVHFLDAHDLPHGNLYKLINQTNSAEQQKSYQAPNAVKNGEDHDNIERRLTGKSTPAYIDAHVNLQQYYLFHSLAEAIRHYDYWPDANKNMVYYFEPTYLPENNNLGKLVLLPWDIDATWGPTWNEGHDVVYDALFSSSASGGDRDANPSLWPAYFSTVREVRDLLWQRDQLEPLLREYAAILKIMEAADADRWKSGPRAEGNYSGLTGAGLRGVDAMVTDMLNFAFVGGSWPGGNVGQGGRAAFLDQLQGSQGEAAQIPATPTISYQGAPLFPADSLRFRTSPFADPQGNDTFAAIEWRVAEVTDPTAPAYRADDPVLLEWTTSWESGELATFASEVEVPSSAVTPGHAYRARVRMQDATGRWSHWSAPVQFIATAGTGADLATNLRISEIHYHPANPNQAEVAAGFNDADDFEFIELVNIGNATINLRNAEFRESDVQGDSQGIAFRFVDGTIPTLAPGQRVVIVEDLAAFQFRYGDQVPVAGVWGGALANGGEQLTLIGDGQIIQQFTYDDGWHPATDGQGRSLEILDPAASLDRWGQADGWAASHVIDGTPGRSARVIGDSNADGLFSSSDLVRVFQAGEYEDAVEDNSTFEEGDWNGDGDFTTFDLVLAFALGQYQIDRAIAAARSDDDPFEDDGEQESLPLDLALVAHAQDAVWADWYGGPNRQRRRAHAS